MESIGVSNVMQILALIALVYSLPTIYLDAIKKRSFAFLIKHYLNDPVLLARADAAHLEVFKRSGGTKRDFRNKVMRPLLEKR
ncbi:hypothetical protein [Vibrio sp. Hal054]|uniref:hypothetical protein n=1 Tax=Vibrio sp. Hal054 TaxID=3035158 RepID=UPI00301C6DF6